MSDSSSFTVLLLGAISTLFGIVTSLALFIWRQEVARRKQCEGDLDGYEKPARVATQELLANARMMRHGAAREGVDPWPWPDSSSRPRPRTRRRSP